MNDLVKNTKFTRVLNATAAGSSDITTCAVIDMAGFEAVTFFVAFGTITASAVTSIKVQQGTDGTVSDAADLEGSSVTIADTDDNKIAAIEIYRPRERYVKLIIKRATANAVVDGAWAIQTGPRVKPTTHDSTTVVTPEFWASPAEGTA